MANTTRPSVPPSHSSGVEHRRQLANVLNLLNQTTPDYSETTDERNAGVSIIDKSYPPGDPRRIKPVVNGEVKINIPSDVASLPEAVRLFPLKVPGCVTVLNIESGHALTAGLQVTDGDYGHIRIEAEDSTVFLDPNFQGVDTESVGGSADAGTDNLIAGVNAVMPVLACVIDMAGKHEHGYVLERGSTGLILNACGVINAGDRGISCRNSTVYAPLSIWDGARGSGAFITRGSVADLQSASLDGCCTTGASADNGALFVSRVSICNFMFGSASDSGTHALRAHRSRVNAIGGDLSGATIRGVFAIQTSEINVQDCDITDCGEHAIWTQGSFVNAHGSDLSGAGTADVFMDRGAYLILTEATTTNAVGTVPSIADVQGPLSFNVPYAEGIAIANGSARWRFTPGGEAPPDDGSISVDCSSSRAGIISSVVGGATAARTHAAFYNSNGMVGSITTAGAATAFNTSSDATLKDDDGEMSAEQAIEIVRLWTVRNFRWKSDGMADHGLFAQELYRVYPRAVTVGGYYTDEDGVTHYRPWAIDYSKLVAPLVRVVQALDARVSLLERK